MKTFIHSLLIMGVLMASVSFAKSQQFESSIQQTTLLELFTSEGCSSCPPAEHWVNSLKDDPRLWKEVIPMAFHVDYWDYIGWKDTFATPENSYRQRRYHQEGGVNTVYTPGFISNGKEWRRWFGIKKIERSTKMPGQLKVSIEDGVIKAQFDSGEVSKTPLKLHVAILGFGLETKIKAGENSGKTLKHDFVVIGESDQTSYSGQWTLPLPKTQQHKLSRKGIALWVSSTNRQLPLQSVGSWID